MASFTSFSLWFAVYNQYHVLYLDDIFVRKDIMH
jgi:hypothetical protein